MSREQRKYSQTKTSNLNGRGDRPTGRQSAKRSARLTIDQFIEELQRVRDSFDWSFEPDTRPGSERRAWPRFWIWGTARTGPATGVKLDPIEAVCYALTGKFPGQKQWKGSGQTIGLSPEDTKDLMAAATDRTWLDRDGRRRPDGYLQSLRVRLLQAIEENGGRINL